MKSGNRNSAALKPFVKWAGGKRQLLPEIRKYLPHDITERTYYEPFVGAGALLFDLKPAKAVINDSCRELMLTYRIIRDHADELISILRNHEEKYSPDYYYEVRARDSASLSETEMAARFIFLNKTCYNGLYRVNSKGLFNVPVGRHKTLNICEESLLRDISRYMNSADIAILNADFEKAVEGVDGNSFVYFDPPYYSPKKSGFSAYQAGGFSEDDHVRLRDLFLNLTAKDVPCLLSNSDAPFTRELYRNVLLRTVTVTARRVINSRQSGRGKINEILVKKNQDEKSANITYREFGAEYLDAVHKLQNEWFYENITFGLGPDTAETISGWQNGYFFIALDGADVIGYVAAEIVTGNEFNIFPKGSGYLRVNDLYVAKNYRNREAGKKLLSLVEEKAYAAGLLHVFISSATMDADAVRRFYSRSGYGIWTTMFYKRKDWETRVFPLNELESGGYRYVVIFARYMDKWLYCRAVSRDTWETPGGHIEKGETALEAAKRELWEETGALKFDIEAAFDYSVHNPDDFSNGQAFIAHLHELGEIPDSTMAEVKCFDAFPEKMRFPKILPVLYEKAKALI